LRKSTAAMTDELSQVPRGGGEQEVVFRAARSSPSRPAEVEVALEMRETHLAAWTIANTHTHTRHPRRKP